MLKENILDILFPRFCLGCGKQGTYLCEDCESCLEISDYQYCLCQKPQRVVGKGKCPYCQAKKLNGLYSALSFQNKFVKTLIHKFKYQPFIKELSKPLSRLIIAHFQLLDNKLDFSDFILIPVPLEKTKLKQRGFNQAQELAEQLSASLKIPVLSNVLIKIKKTLPQAELSRKERQNNIRNAFFCKNQGFIKNQKILLIDDVYTTGSTMEECARVLKQAGAKQVWGAVIARG